MSIRYPHREAESRVGEDINLEVIGIYVVFKAMSLDKNVNVAK